MRKNCESCRYSALNNKGISKCPDYRPGCFLTNNYYKWQPKEGPMYEILKPVSRKSVYDALPGNPPGAKCSEALKRYEIFDRWFGQNAHKYLFTGEILVSDLLPYFTIHPTDLQWLIDNGFIGKTKPKFVGFNLPIQTEKEFEILRDLLDGGIRNVTPDETATLWQRLIENLLPHGLT